MIARNAREDSNARWVNIRWKPSVTPSAVTTYRPISSPSSSGPIAWFQSSTIATTNTDQRQRHADQVRDLMGAIHLTGQGYVAGAQVSPNRRTTRPENLCFGYESWLTSPGTSCRPRSRRSCGRRWPSVASEMIEAVATVPGLRAAARRARSGTAIRAGVQEALRHFLARDRGAAASRAPGRLLGARPRRDARRAKPRVAAQRLPRSGRGWRGGGSPRSGVAAGLEPDTLYLLAESMFAYIDVLSSESAGRATRSSSRRPPARPSCAAGGWCGCWSATRRRPERGRGGGRRRRLGAAARRSRCWRSRASSARPSRRGCRPARSARRSASSRAR